MALTANAQLTREEEVALYGEHIRLKAFYPTAVERLIFICNNIVLRKRKDLRFGVKDNV